MGKEYKKTEFEFPIVIVIIGMVIGLLLAFISSVSAHRQNTITEVAPKNFKSLGKVLQKKIINRLIKKKLASDYALSTPISESEEFKKTLKHVLQMNSDLKDKKEEEKFLENILKKDTKIKGYTEEQLYSKKGLLAFYFLVNEQADKIKAALTQKEFKEYYELNKYDTLAMKELLTIVVEDQNKANTIIDELAKSKNKLETFIALAQKYSLALSASKNGYFGKIPTEQLNDQLKPLLKDLRKSEYSLEPIKTEFGYQIFYILNDIPKFNSRFELVKSKVENEFMQQKVKQEANISIKYL